MKNLIRNNLILAIFFVVPSISSAKLSLESEHVAQEKEISIAGFRTFPDCVSRYISTGVKPVDAYNLCKHIMNMKLLSQKNQLNGQDNNYESVENSSGNAELATSE